MSRHLTRRATAPPSQTLPSTTSQVASGATLVDTYVLLCDWRGNIVWKSGTGDHVRIGEEIWKHAAGKSRDRLRAAVASVVALRENHVLEVESDRQLHFRFWIWPLNDPEIAICILALRIPKELALLTDRERSCLACLAQGKSTNDIAKELDIGLTTVHTHLRRSREKLGLTTSEALIGYAARYFFIPAAPSEGLPQKWSG